MKHNSSVPLFFLMLTLVFYSIEAQENNQSTIADPFHYIQNIKQWRDKELVEILSDDDCVALAEQASYLSLQGIAQKLYVHLMKSQGPIVRIFGDYIEAVSNKDDEKAINKLREKLITSLNIYERFLAKFVVMITPEMRERFNKSYEHLMSKAHYQAIVSRKTLPSLYEIATFMLHNTNQFLTLFSLYVLIWVGIDIYKHNDPEETYLRTLKIAGTTIGVILFFGLIEYESRKLAIPNEAIFTQEINERLQRIADLEKKIFA